MIARVDLAQIHRNLKPAEICNLANPVRFQRLAAQTQIDGQSGRQFVNLAQTLVFSRFPRRPRFTENSPHYMWGKTRGFCPHINASSPAPIFPPRTGGRRP